MTTSDDCLVAISRTPRARFILLICTCNVQRSWQLQNNPLFVVTFYKMCSFCNADLQVTDTFKVRSPFSLMFYMPVQATENREKPCQILTWPNIYMDLSTTSARNDGMLNCGVVEFHRCRVRYRKSSSATVRAALYLYWLLVSYGICTLLGRRTNI